MKRTSLTMLLPLAAIICACSNPAETVIPTDIARWEKELAPQLERMPSAERELAASYLKRLEDAQKRTGIPIQAGLTLASVAVDEQELRDISAQRQKAKEVEEERLSQERVVAEEAVRRATDVTLISKAQHRGKGSYSNDVQQFTLAVLNKSDKPIAGVAGELQFLDLFGDKVGAVAFKITDTMAPGQTYLWSGERDYNQYIPEHRAVWNLEEGKYTVKYEPDMVVFADGTRLAVPR